jgi:hypothetical protein
VGIIFLSLTEDGDAVGESFYLGLGFFPRGTVGQDARNLGDFCDPPAVVFQLEFDVDETRCIGSLLLEWF